MARMIPNQIADADFNHSPGEEEVYRALSALPDDYVIFHSVHWHQKDRNGYIRWGESDYTVLDPRRGILVIEVKSGSITYDGYRMIQTNTLTGESKVIDPIKQANRSKHTFIQLMEDRLLENDIYWVESAVWFTSVGKGELKGSLPLSYADGNMLFKEDLEYTHEAINRVFQYYNMRPMALALNSHKQAIIDLLAPKFRAIPSIANTVREEDACFARMTSEQYYLLDYLEEQKSAVIQGGAGTGKTMLAVEKARRLSQDEKVLFLCFNRFLFDYLKKKFSSSMPNVHFSNLHTYASMTLHKDVNDDDISYLLNNYDDVRFAWNYKSIIIDEGQDFSEEHLALLSSIVQLQGGSFYVFYDKNQLVQQRSKMAWFSSVECRLVLSLNCRNTRSIAETSFMPLDIREIRMRTDVAGRKPNFYITKNKNELMALMKNIIRGYTDTGFRHHQIVILTMGTVDHSVLSDLSSIPPYRLSSIPGDGNILFTTAKKFKGLESDVVILIDIDDKTFSNEENRRVFYVGASRAKHYLDIIALADEEKEKAISRKINENGRNPRLAIMSGLKVKVI